MSNKRTVKNKMSQRLASRHRSRGLTKPAVVALVVCMIAAGTAATRWEPIRRRMGLSPAAVPAAPQQGNLDLSKEYIYAGGRLIATEEPTPQGPPPTNLVATAASTTSVSLMWTAPTSGVITGYVVERTHKVSLEPIEISTGSAAPGFIDASASIDKAYLYRVRAVFTGGSTSGYSNKDLATTVFFTDQPLQAVVITANHLKEARRAVNAIRDLANVGQSSWTYPDPVSSPSAQQRVIYLEDMTELRTNINPGFTALEITPLPGDVTLDRGLPVKREHIQDVRDKVR